MDSMAKERYVLFGVYGKSHYLTGAYPTIAWRARRRYRYFSITALLVDRMQSTVLRVRHLAQSQERLRSRSADAGDGHKVMGPGTVRARDMVWNRGAGRLGQKIGNSRLAVARSMERLQCNEHRDGT